MNIALTIPSSINKHRYRNIHVEFIISYAKLAGIDIQYAAPSDKLYTGGVDDDNDQNICVISCLINNHQVIFDFWDFTNKGSAVQIPNVLYFKMQYDEDVHNKLNNVFPIGPMFILDKTRSNKNGVEAHDYFEEYFDFRKSFNYDCSGNIILNKQRIYGKAVARRNKVQNILKKTYNVNVDTKFTTNYKKYWREQENCLTMVCVPGACENSLDRGQIESIGLGVCTISPKINISLPHNKKLIKDKHYIVCKNDYSDLIKKIEWCRTNRKECVKIGKNAKQLFTENCLPKQHWEWIMQCVANFYGENK